MATPTLPRPTQLTAPLPLPDFSIETAFGEGWRVLRRRYGLLLAVALLFLLIELAVEVADSAFQSLTGLWLLDPISILFLDPPLTAGVMYVAVRTARGEPAQLGDMFRGFHRLLVLAGIRLVFLLLVIGALVPGGVIAGATLLATSSAGTPVAVGVIVAAATLSFVLAVFLAVRVGLASLIAIDQWGHRPGVMGSIAASWHLTAGMTWLQLAVVALLLGLITAATLVALVLPALFFGVPLLIAVWGSAYALIAARHGIGPASGEVCPTCGYDLAGLGESICPECGTALA